MGPKAKNEKGKGKDAGDKSSAATKTKGAKSVSVRHVLCERFSKKEEALAKLKSGAKFDEVAREFSEDKARQGGALGWITKESVLPEFSAIAFELDSSTVGNPKWGECKTSEGYHIIMVEARK